MNNMVLAQLAALKSAPVADLKQKWRDLFDREPPPYSRRFLESRLAYRIQELAYGGLSEGQGQSRSNSNNAGPAQRYKARRVVTKFAEQFVGVLSQPGRRPVGRLRAATHHRRRCHPVVAIAGQVQALNTPALGDKRIIQSFREIVDRCRRNPAGEYVEPLCRRLLRQFRIEHVLDQCAVLQPFLERRKALILGPFLTPEHAAKVQPELLLVAHQEDPAVAGGVELAWRERGMRRTWQPFLHMAFVEVPDSRIGHVAERNVE